MFGAHVMGDGFDCGTYDETLSTEGLESSAGSSQTS